MEIRAASASDLEGIERIYAHHVLHGTGTFEEEPPDAATMGARMERGLAAGYCWLVAADETGPLGFGYYGPFRERAASRWRTASTCARTCAARAWARRWAPA